MPAPTFKYIHEINWKVGAATVQFCVCVCAYAKGNMLWLSFNINK